MPTRFVSSIVTSDHLVKDITSAVKSRQIRTDKKSVQSMSSVSIFIDRGPLRRMSSPHKPNCYLVRPFPVDWIVQELEVISSTGALSPYFCDEEFFGGSFERADLLADEIIARKQNNQINPKLNFYIDAMASSILGKGHGGLAVSIPTLRKLVRAGLREVFIGIESGDHTQLHRYRKPTTPSQSIQALQILRELGLTVDIGFIMFDKSVKLEQVAANLEFIRLAGLASNDANLVKKMRIQPGTQLEQKLLSDSKISRENFDFDNLEYLYEFEDERVSMVLNVYTDWEKKHREEIYTLQASLRGEVVSEEYRSKIKKMIGNVRKIDLTFLEQCVSTILPSSQSSHKCLLSGGSKLAKAKERSVQSAMNVYREQSFPSASPLLIVHYRQQR